MAYTVPRPFQAKGVSYPAYHSTVYWMNRVLAVATPSRGPILAGELNRFLYTLFDMESVQADALVQSLTEWIAAARAGGGEWRDPLPPAV